MVDQDWLKHLATAQLHGGQWQPADSGAVARLTEQRIASAADELAQLAIDYGETLSDISRGQLCVRLLPVQSGLASQPSGFLLLLGRCQLTIALQPPWLEVTLITVQGFERRPRRLHRFEALSDPFGTVVWRMDNTLLMTGELIIKRLFEDLIRAAHEAGELTRGG